jgi:chromosome partitioning protein
MGEHLIKNVVLKNARLKRYDGSGITMEKTKKGLLKQWDRKSHELFISILKRIGRTRELVCGGGVIG